MRNRVAAIAFAISALPQIARAQGQECTIQHLPTSRGTTYPEQQMTFIGGGVRFVCPGGVSVSSDSLAHIGAAGLVEFVGNVHYADTLKTLTAGYAQYIGAEHKVIARDRVVLTDKKNGSTILAPFLDYYQASETRPEAQVVIYSGRPRAILVREGRDGAPADTTTVDSDAMQIHGERLFVGQGNVILTRGKTQAFGNAAQFDQAGDSMRIEGNARIVSEDYQLRGDTITASMTEANEFREVMARRDARLDSQDMTAEAPRLRILLENGEVNRLIAVGSASAPTRTAPIATTGVTAPPPDAATTRPSAAPASAMGGTSQARATSLEFRMVADSIDALTLGQKIEKLVAVGSAFGERITPDTAAPRPAAAQNDWMRGDTIVATFVQAPEPRPDTARNDRVLETITVVGTEVPAQSLYALPDEQNPGGKPTLSYLLALRIEVTMKEGKVANVRADSAVHGLYLRPDTARASGGRTAQTARVRNR